MAVLLTAATLAGCGGAGGSASASSVASAAQSASVGAEPETFTSPLYGYSVDLPAEWNAYPATEPWAGEGPDAQGSQYDALEAPRQVPNIFAMAMAVDPGTDLETWSEVGQAVVDEFVDIDWCDPVTESGELRIGGEEGRYAAAECAGGTRYVVWAFTVRDGQGYSFVWHSDRTVAEFDPEADRAAFEEILATVEFPG